MREELPTKTFLAVLGVLMLYGVVENTPVPVDAPGHQLEKTGVAEDGRAAAYVAPQDLIGQQPEPARTISPPAGAMSGGYYAVTPAEAYQVELWPTSALAASLRSRLMGADEEQLGPGRGLDLMKQEKP